MIKVTAADRWFGLCIKERAGWRCERCTKAYTREQAQGLDVSHFWGRSIKATRCDPDNAAAHCRGCHQYLGSHPVLFGEWIKGYLGPRYDRLALTVQPTFKGWKSAEPQVAAWYRDLYRGMLRLRQSGVTARIEFADWRRQEDPPLWVP
jgi:hypothetical protein